MFRDDISKVAGSSLCKSRSPGHQVDGVPGALSTPPIVVGPKIDQRPTVKNEVGN